MPCHGVPRISLSLSGTPQARMLVRAASRGEDHMPLTRSSAHQCPLFVAEACAHTELRNTLRTVQPSFVLHNNTSIQVALVHKGVHDTLLAIRHVDCTNLATAHHNDWWARLLGVAINLQVQ